MGEGRVQNVLMLGTVPHQLVDGGKVVEKTPGSGILDMDVSHVLRQLGKNVFNFFPSFHARGNPHIRPLRFGPDSPHGLTHKIPIFTKTPISDYRFDQMTKGGFVKYMQTFVGELADFISHIEATEGKIDIAHVAHLFNNMVGMAMVNQSRIQDGKQPIPVVAQAHGTALKFFRTEGKMMDMGARWLMGSPSQPWNLSLTDAVYEYAAQNFKAELGSADGEGLEFLKQLRNPMLVGFLELVAPSLLGVGGILSISDNIKAQIHQMFPDYPIDSVLTVPNGLRLEKFYPIEGLSQPETLMELQTTPTTGSRPIARTDLNADHIVVFTGKFAAWKNLDAFLRATHAVEQYFEPKGKRVVTLVIGTGEAPDIAKYEGVAKSLGLKHTYFLGQLPHSMINKLNNLASVGVYPSTNEPFGLVGIECMACRTPAIAGTGGFTEFIDNEVGAILKDPTDVTELSHTIVGALKDNWKAKKGPAARARAETFDWTPKVGEYIEFYEKVIAGHNGYRPARVARFDFAQLMHKLQVLKLSPALVKGHLLKLAPDAEKAELPSELIRQALKHGSCVKTTHDIELVTRGIEKKMEGLSTKK